jgi:NADH-quinone oxidoreductase subunit I
MGLKDVVKKATFFEILQGMSVTGGYFVGDKVTVEYPKEKCTPYPRYRGMHALISDPETGELNCDACQLCATICPSRCITIESSEDNNGGKRLDRFDLDLARCIFCGFCEEVCPRAAIVMTPVYELATYDKSEFSLTMEKLLDNQVNAHKDAQKR